MVSAFAAQTGQNLCMCINTNETQAIQIAGTALEIVNKFYYLGRIITKNGESAADIRNCILKDMPLVCWINSGDRRISRRIIGGSIWL